VPHESIPSLGNGLYPIRDCERSEVWKIKVGHFDCEIMC